jgi:hypothetical protein
VILSRRGSAIRNTADSPSTPCIYEFTPDVSAMPSRVRSLQDHLLGFVGAASALDLHPLARLEILIVGQEMLDLHHGDVGEIGIVFDAVIARRGVA